MQPDSLCRISLQTHKITHHSAMLYGQLNDDASNIHLTLSRINHQQYSISIMRQKNNSANQYSSIFNYYTTPTNAEQTHLTPFFESTSLSVLEQHITTLLTQWIKPSSIERMNILLHFMRRVHHHRLQYEDTTNRLYYYDEKGHKHVYWDSLSEIHQWCDIPPFHYCPEAKKWRSKNIPHIVPYLLTNQQWNRPHTSSMHESINILRRAKALHIPSFPHDIPIFD